MPSVAAVCVYPTLVPTAVERLAGSGVKVASVATAFPSGQSPLALKVGEVEEAVALGADEIDMVIDRGALASSSRFRATVSRLSSAVKPRFNSPGASSGQ